MEELKDVKFTTNKHTVILDAKYYYEFLTDNKENYIRRSNGVPYVFDYSEPSDVEYNGRPCKKITMQSSRTKLTKADEESVRGPRKINFYFDTFNVWTEYVDSIIDNSHSLASVRTSGRYKRSRRGKLLSDLDDKLTLNWRRYNAQKLPGYEDKLKNYIDRCAEVNQLL